MRRLFFTPIIFLVLTFVIVLSLSFDNQVFAERTIIVEKTLDIEKDKLQETLVDLENYEKIFPQYVKSATIIDTNDETTIARLKLDTGFVPISVDAEVINLENGENEIRVLSGDLKGSTITTKLEKTWSYNGIPNMGTNIVVDLTLEVSGFLALVGLVTDDLIKYSIDKSLLSFVDYSKGEIKKSQSPVKSKSRSR